MGAWVMCKCRLGYGTKLDDSIFELISMQTLLDTLLFFPKQFLKFIQRDGKLFIISVHKPINEPINGNGMNEMAEKLLEEYLDVFLANLPGLALAKEIDHAIDSMSDATPISRAPYQLPFVKYGNLEQK